MKKIDININKEQGRTCRVQNRCGVIKLSNFLKNLKPKQRASLEGTAFAPLLSLPKLMVSQSLMYDLLQRWCVEKKTFQLGGKYVEFSLSDIALILGLRVVDAGGTSLAQKSKKYDILKRIFEGKKIIKQRDVEAALRKYHGDDHLEEHTRLALVYIMMTLLFPNSGTSIKSSYVALVKDLSKFNSMAWGKFVHEKLVESLCHASVQLKRDCTVEESSRVLCRRSSSETGRQKSVILQGCTVAIQIWAFEHIPSLQPQSSLTSFPRILRYSWVAHSYKNKDVGALTLKTLDLDDVIKVLHPTPIELNEPVIREVLDMKNGSSSVSCLMIDDEHDRGTSIEDKKVWSLGRYRWLTSDIMEEYIDILRRRNYSLHKDQNHLRCIFLSVYFMVQLCYQAQVLFLIKLSLFFALQQMVKLRLDGARAHLETKNAGYSFENCDKIFIPGHWDENHWVLYVVNMKERRLEFYNSLNTTHHCNNDIDDLVAFFGKNFFSMYDWKYKHFVDTPQQGNGHDCGFFVLKYIECLSEGENLNFGQNDISRFRKQVLADIRANVK
ncbi:uncharacterized protein LOC116265167 isoform X2 [Nymphaea colorata]|uniref:uncharacterized protein LOC116265167 isoform X2 n=1 Tax=Nymphaea colorata TaxID=210225 RepID=UPI00129DFE9C|nr:uncharacterized protein LOC116265167 isoform X2 [Nymphaea colorata]XP_031501565.1 uncharacterized protein LOC116265167 isoform X2 [Nymphaea colorata]XP_031501566.1 uncharacterized protein LOC116265167 isoform X2 [Nymphaea colorata]